MVFPPILKARVRQSSYRLYGKYLSFVSGLLDQAWQAENKTVSVQVHQGNQADPGGTDPGKCPDEANLGFVVMCGC